MAPSVLIIGGTGFLGRHLTARALQAGWAVTLFNRGRRAPDRFPDVPTLVGDRDRDLRRLASGRWDAIWDTCGYVPRVVGGSAAHLASRAEHYTFVSSVSAYEGFGGTNQEADQLATLEDPSVESITGDTYGGLKAASERAATEAFGAERTLLVRPGLIVGPHDHTDRFAYWPWRVQKGGPVVAPGRPDALVQVIDVRDLAEWMVHATEHRLYGAYNTVGPASPTSMHAVLTEVVRVVEPSAELVWVPDDVLLEHDVMPWTGLPLWVPDLDAKTSVAKAVAAGLTHRPLADTIAATRDWLREEPRPGAFANTLSPGLEATLLARVR